MFLASRKVWNVGSNFVSEQGKKGNWLIRAIIFSVSAMHNPYANHTANHTVMTGPTGVPDVHKRDKDAIYG